MADKTHKRIGNNLQVLQNSIFCSSIVPKLSFQPENGTFLVADYLPYSLIQITESLSLGEAFKLNFRWNSYQYSHVTAGVKGHYSILCQGYLLRVNPQGQKSHECPLHGCIILEFTPWFIFYSLIQKCITYNIQTIMY